MRLTLAIFKFLVVLAFVLAPSALFAQNDIGNVFGNMQTSVSPLPRFMYGFCYILGIVALAVGLIKLRGTVDNPGENKIQSAIAALTVGAFLIALPYAIKIGQSITGSKTETIATNPTMGDFKGKIIR